MPGLPAGFSDYDPTWAKQEWLNVFANNTAFDGCSTESRDRATQGRPAPEQVRPAPSIPQAAVPLVPGLPAAAGLLSASLRPRPPYRAWGFPSCSPGGPSDCPLLSNIDSFGATNLYLTANGNAINESAVLNSRGVATLSWASGPDNPDPRANLTGWYVNYTNPQVTHCESPQAASCHDDDDNLRNYTWAGVAIDEWNPDPCPCKFCDQYRTAAAGWRQARQRWPLNFVTLWASHEGLTPDQQTVLAAIVREGTIDLLVFEAYTYNWEGSGSLDRAAIERRLSWAKARGIISKTIPCFGFVLSTNPRNRTQQGMSYEEIESLASYFKGRFPEMPGVAFSSEGLAWNDTGSFALVKRTAALAQRLYPDLPE